MKGRKVKTFTVDRALWGKDWLLDGNTGKMCCMGFYCRAAGFSKDEIEGLGLPSEVYEECPLTHVENEIARVNDDKYMSYAKKEVKLTKMFAEKGIKIKFKGERR